jgi:17beta-estradiol 17-dehydrogenase / very-long-chain 3-oxoacyl-CoA reductase
LNTILLIIGAYILARLCFTLWRIFEEIYILKELDLAERYGKGSWACITGATDGIGLGFVRQLAQRGFNILMISRTQSKLDKRQKEIIAQFPNIKVETHAADFENSNDPEFVRKIEQKFNQFDVSILVNNVGISTELKSFIKAGVDINLRCTTVNILSQVLMSRMMIKKARKRVKKSGIIDLASVASLMPLPEVEIYSPTKMFNRRFGVAHWFKDKDKIDRITVNPGYVSTNLIKNREVDLITCSTDDCARATLRSLGHRVFTFGDKKHIWFCHYMILMRFIVPYKFLAVMLKYSANDAYKKAAQSQ